MEYSPPKFPETFKVLKSKTSWSPKVSNSLSLNYFEDNTYDKVKTYSKVNFYIMIISGVIFVMSIFWKKMIGV